MARSYVSPAKIAAVAIMATLWPVAAAHATTYCVSQSGSCSDGQTLELSVQAALNAAATDLPGPNVVAIGPGTYDAAGGGFDYSTPGSPAVRISGEGQGVTTLRANSSSTFALRVGVGGSSVTDLTISVRTPMDAGLVLDSAGAHRVDVTGAGTLPSTDGVALSNGALFADGSVAMPGSSHADVDQVSGATGTVSHAHLSGPVGLTTAAAGQPGLAARDVVISATDSAVSAPATSTIAVDEALILMHGDSPTALESANGDLTVRGATIASVDRGGTGASVDATDTSPASLTLQDSIVRGFDSSFSRSADPGSAANLTAQYDDLHLSGAGSGSTPGTVTFDHTIDADPQFVDAGHGDYHLFAHSPAIDAGGPCDALCVSLTDLAGEQPMIDGDGDGSAVRDLGAYEYARRPPNASISTLSGVAANAQARFDGSSSWDSDDGVRLTYAWSFDDGGSAVGPIALHAFAKAGQHRAALTVTDSSGLTSTALAYLQIGDEPVGPQGSGPSHHKLPVVTGLSFSPSRFAVGPKATATSARSRSSRSQRHHHGPVNRTPVGTSIRLRLNETATVTVVIAKVLHGHQSHGRCAATARHGRSCTLSQPVGALTRNSVHSGKVTIAFSGRIGSRALAPGIYTATVTANDSVRNVSKPARAQFTIVGA